MTVTATATETGSAGALTAGTAHSDFGFRCLGHDFRAWIESGNGRQVMCVSCELGDLPYSAENGYGRRSALTLLSQAASFEGTRISLSGFRSVSLTTVVPVDDNDDAATRISRAVHAVLRAAPLIALFGEITGKPPAA